MLVTTALAAPTRFPPSSRWVSTQGPLTLALAQVVPIYHPHTLGPGLDPTVIASNMCNFGYYLTSY